MGVSKSIGFLKRGFGKTGSTTGIVPSENGPISAI